MKSIHPVNPALNQWFRVALMLAIGLWLTGCRSSYYAVMESFGKPKRELLTASLVDASEEQKKANEQFKDTLTQLKELTGFDGGDLEKKYASFKGEYEACDAQASRVTSRINKVEQIGRDLFAEWEKEMEQITSPRLRQGSQSRLSATKYRFNDLVTSLHRSEQTMPPVLAQMKDYTLYLKHNLNARAIGSLQQEAEEIEADIMALIGEMNQSISQTESFIKELEVEPSE